MEHLAVVTQVPDVLIPVKTRGYHVVVVNGHRNHGPFMHQHLNAWLSLVGRPQCYSPVVVTEVDHTVVAVVAHDFTRTLMRFVSCDDLSARNILPAVE